jgi:molybdopterin-guanine dinucleotide biosynthesis protein MobB
MAQHGDARAVDLPRVVTVTGLRGSGKTTVVEALLRELTRRGLRACSIKSTSHDCVTIQPEAVDTRRHLAAGAEIAVAISATETAVFLRGTPVPAREIIGRLLPPDIDWIVCEGAAAELAPAPVILCLARFEDYEEAVRIREVAESRILAISGAAAASPDAGRIHPGAAASPVLNVLDPQEARRLADIVMGTA